MTRDLDITVLLPTHSRSDILRKTLKQFTGLDRDGLNVEFVIVDNNSGDDTADVIKSFADRLPVRYVFEREPGKNRALNRGLEEADLGRVILFTDDDVNPKQDWLHAVMKTCEHWPRFKVFGGKIDPIWPSDDVPGWALDPFILDFGFARHDYAAQDQPYRPGEYPFGPNYWIRREVLDGGRRFNESIGPHPTNRILGDETLFLKELREDGYEQMYTPTAVVGHRIQVENFSEPGIKRRAATLGRGGPIVGGLCHQKMLAEHPRRWRMRRIAALWYYRLQYAAAQLAFSHGARVVRSVRAIHNIAYNQQSLRLASARNGDLNSAERTALNPSGQQA